MHEEVSSEYYGMLFHHGGFGILSTALLTARIGTLAIARTNDLRFHTDAVHGRSCALWSTWRRANGDAGLPDNFNAWAYTNGHVRTGRGRHAHLALCSASLSTDGRRETRLLALLVQIRHIFFFFFFLEKKDQSVKISRREDHSLVGTSPEDVRHS